jgi:GT2 family glycosyltransferase
MGVNGTSRQAARKVEGDRATVTVDVTAVVCTRNRTAQLERAIDSLKLQEWMPREILVVDNAPTDESTLHLVQQRYPNVRYVRESVPGLDFARNRALGSAQCEIVAFLDDDAVARRDWCRSLVHAFEENERVAVCTGLVEPLRLETEAQRLFEANGGLARGRDCIRLPIDRKRPLHGRPGSLVAWATRIGVGCNLAVRRVVALELGGFDVALDLGGVLPGGGDLDIVWRALVAGYETLYLPEAVVLHEHRREMEAVCDQIVGHQRALVAFLVKTSRRARGGQRVSVIAFLLWRLVKPGIRLALRATRGDPLTATVLLRMWWNCWRGIGAYGVARRVAQRRVAAAHGGSL